MTVIATLASASRFDYTFGQLISDIGSRCERRQAVIDLANSLAL